MSGQLQRFIRNVVHPQWHRKAVGGLWEEIGQLQFDFLIQQGLKSHHHFLDIGCGSLRGGVHFIAYLEPGHYVGIDKNEELLVAGKSELRKRQLLSKNPTLVQMEDFHFERLQHRFDYTIAQSVFTHIPLNQIIACIQRAEEVLVDGGRFYATFWNAGRNKFALEPVPHVRSDGPVFQTFFDRDPYHYNVDVFKWICEGTRMQVQYLGPWNHPRDQHMLVFIKGDKPFVS